MHYSLERVHVLDLSQWPCEVTKIRRKGCTPFRTISCTHMHSLTKQNRGLDFEGLLPWKRHPEHLCNEAQATCMQSYGLRDGEISQLG
jgi:hypothetical protein